MARDLLEWPRAGPRRSRASGDGASSAITRAALLAGALLLTTIARAQDAGVARPDTAAETTVAPEGASPPNETRGEASPNGPSPEHASEPATRSGALSPLEEVPNTADASAPTDDVPDELSDVPSATEALRPAAITLERVVYDDGVHTGDVPWDPVDDVHVMYPRGTHLGVQLRVAGALGKYDAPLFELGGVLDHRYVDHGPWHFRAVLALSYQVHVQENAGGGTTYTSNPLALRLRLFPLSVDIGEYFTVRVSGELGMAFTPRPGFETWATTFLWGALGEIGIRLMEGQLEIAVSGGLHMSTQTTVDRIGYREGFFHQGIIGGRLGWMF